MRAIALLLAACGGATAQAPDPGSPGEASPHRADVLRVEDVTGEPGAYTFAVTVASTETGCDRYADWWEVVREDGTLAHRRVLAHAHTTEQPFTRTGGPVPVAADERIWIRAHLHPAGYTGQALVGSVAGGFAPADPPAGFGAALATTSPLPDGCAF